jgi:hypothetical protein
MPLVDRVSSYVDTSFERVETALNKLVRDIDDRMDAAWHLAILPAPGTG